MFPQALGAVSSGYGWEVDRESREIVAVDSNGVVEISVNDGKDGRTLLPRYRQRRYRVDFVDDTDSEDDKLAATTARLSLAANTQQQVESEARPIPAITYGMSSIVRSPGYSCTSRTVVSGTSMAAVRIFIVNILVITLSDL